MIDLYESQITDILPDNIKTDPVVQAVSYAISNMVKKIVNEAGKTAIYAVIDTLEEDALDLLAVEFRAKYYGEWLSLEEKRIIIKKTLLWYCRAGTLFTVQELTDFVFEDAKIEEWFQYGAEAYLFRVIANVISQDMTLKKYMEFLKSIYEVKNTRSHLESVIFKYDTNTEVKTVAAGAMGSIIKVKARLVEQIGAATEDRLVPVVLLNQNIKVKCDNEIKENEVYVLGEDGRKVRVLTENGSVVTVE